MTNDQIPENAQIPRFSLSFGCRALGDFGAEGKPPAAPEDSEGLTGSEKSIAVERLAPTVPLSLTLSPRRGKSHRTCLGLWRRRKRHRWLGDRRFGGGAQVRACGSWRAPNGPSFHGPSRWGAQSLARHEFSKPSAGNQLARTEWRTLPWRRRVASTRQVGHLSRHRPKGREVLDCASPLALSERAAPGESGRGLPHSTTLPRSA